MKKHKVFYNKQELQYQKLLTIQRKIHISRDMKRVKEKEAKVLQIPKWSNDVA